MIKESPLKGEREHYQDLIRILDYLDEHYTTDSRATIGKLNPGRTTMAGRPLRHARHNGKSKWSFVANLPLNLSHFFATDIISDNLDAKDVYRKLKAGTEVEWVDKETGVQYALSPLNETTVILLGRGQGPVISGSARRNSSGRNSPPQQYVQTAVTLTARQMLNLRRMIREHQSELQYLNISAAQRSEIASWFDQILGAVLSPHTLD